MKFLNLILILLLTVNLFSQTETKNDSISLPMTNSVKKNKGSFYFLWGYTRAKFSKSTIHFKNPTGYYYPETGRYHDYDFTIYDAKAHDRPDFNQIKDVINITIPQFITRVGYYFNNKADIGLEINYDHTKYVVTDYQKVRVKGTFNGNYVDKDTLLDPNSFLHFEHTDGANFWMLNFIKRWKVINQSKKINLGLIVKPGVGVVFPRTDVTMLGTRLNNNWHVAGWIIGAETGLRLEFLKYGVVELTGKGSYADYRKVYVLGRDGSKAHHHFFTAQLSLTVGASF